MKRRLDPGTVMLMLSSRLGGVPYQLVVHVAGKRDVIVLDGQQVHARGPGQAVGQYQQWAISDYADLDQRTALEKLSPKIAQVEVLTSRSGAFKVAQKFDHWNKFISWLRDVDEPIVRFTVEFPRSLYHAGRQLAARRKAEGGRGSLKELLIGAMEEYIERHS